MSAATITADRGSGRVEVDGRWVGTIHFPYEYCGKRVGRSTYLLILAGINHGRYSTFDAAAGAAREFAVEALADVQRLGGKLPMTTPHCHCAAGYVCYVCLDRAAATSEMAAELEAIVNPAATEDAHRS